MNMKNIRSLLLVPAVVLALLGTSSPAASPTLPEGVVSTQDPKDQPPSPLESLKKITVPDGFKVTLFAGEPDVMQPISFDIDDRGRLWVVENFSYPDFKTEDKDRIIILTDKDSDGRFDERKVFLENGRRLTSIVNGFGGVWVLSPPELLFIPDANGDGVPDGPPVVHLDGWTTEASHNMVNGLIWGPDGWLYGRQGILVPSLVGKPGTPEGERTKVGCGVWRYHPTRKIFEMVADGTTNPWGMDFDERGQAFISNCVIAHLWHVVPGAHWQRMYGEDANIYTYDLMPAISDHFHWDTREKWSDVRKLGVTDTSNQAGGGHAHEGAMVYLGDNWPDAYRGTIMMGNIHGNRLLYDTLERKGSGYTARHGKPFLMANDPWFRPITMDYGPDGGVFVSDWSDLGECHDNDGVHRTSGRIYKITYGQPKPLGDLNLARLNDAELVKLQLHKNDWYVRHARRLLQERAAAGKLSKSTADALLKILKDNPDETRKLRALWALHSIDQADEAFLLKQLDQRSEHLRWWAVQFLCEDKKASPAVLKKFTELARTDSSALVRLSLASALQRLPLVDRWGVAEALASHEADTADQNLPLMLWYGIEPLVPADRTRAIQFMGKCKLQLVRQFITRRLAAN